jgi:mRNA-degrading endonuclease RelE of RelBE toxin-antitoxin system
MQGVLCQTAVGSEKIRWSIDGRGKRGGMRILYYYDANRGIILMLFVFAKNERSDLTRDQLILLSSIVQEEFR